MAITLSQYTAARSLFQQHYFLADCDTDFGGQEVYISWSDLQTEVDDYIQKNNVAANDAALRFVLCYSPSDNILYLRMQICTLALVTPDHYSLDTSSSVWYEIKGDQINTTQDTSLSDSDYLNSFYYCDAAQCDKSSLVNLASDTSEEIFVRNLTFPWGLEILEMYNDNQNVEYISFGASSFANSTPSVAYPHTLVLFLMDSNKDKLLDNTPYPNTFEMKGCDIATLCPVCCNCYNTPQ